MVEESEPTVPLDRIPGVVVMCGVPFAGKSTLARVIAARLAARLIEIDAVIADDPRSALVPIPDAAWSAAYRRGEELLRDGLRAGERVIWDGVAFRRVMRDRLRRVAREFGADVLVGHVTTPAAEIAARRARNRVRPTRGDVDEATFAMVRDRFQVPGDDEWVIRYDGGEPAEAWVTRVFPE
ncbi:MAG TPA: AAA family ATPase [Thermomicrobiales bacterium]|jgi:predicted kinase|nr:AAA family ATPase [Thermomicrobiales bacterium]